MMDVTRVTRVVRLLQDDALGARALADGGRHGDGGVITWWMVPGRRMYLWEVKYLEWTWPGWLRAFAGGRKRAELDVLRGGWSGRGQNDEISRSW